MKTYMGSVYGIRHYMLSPLSGCLRGATGRKWYSARQKARCNFASKQRLRLRFSQPYGKNGRTHAQDIREAAAQGQDLRCPHVSHVWGLSKQFEGLNLSARCGINMYNTLVLPGSRHDSLRQRTPGDTHAITKGWGKVVVHEDGYRVEQALVTHLYVPDAILSIHGIKRPDLPLYFPGFTKRDVIFLDTLEEFKEAWKNASNLLVPIPASESR